MPYKLETYSGIMANISSLHLSEIGKYKVSNTPTEFRDYDEMESKTLNVRDLSKEERTDRVEKVLRSLEYMSIKGNQTNHLTDTKPKFIILGEYSWGNNVFQGLIKKDGVDIEMLKESLEQNEEYRLSPIYIGINKLFDDEYYNKLLELKEAFKDCDFVSIDNVHNTFDKYIEYMKETLE